jgi:hypothetical protein
MKSYQSVEIAGFEDKDLSALISYIEERIYLVTIDKIFLCDMDDNIYEVKGDFAYINLN